MNAVANIEAKKKFEFLESISSVMDAHMRYYKQVKKNYAFYTHVYPQCSFFPLILSLSLSQGYELLSQIQPFVHQV